VAVGERPGVLPEQDDDEALRLLHGGVDESRD
jgi:hypothetical protein